MFTGLIKFFEGRLATIFDKVRVSSPILYLGIIVLVFGGSAAIENFTGLAEELPWLFNGVLDEVLKGLTAALLSSRTKRHIDGADDSGAGILVNDVDHDD